MMSSFVLLIAIAAQSSTANPDFDTDVMPIFSRMGCNSAECHGGAAGRGGLHLSLFGGDPAGDYRRIVHELEGRRIDRSHPESSLLVSKPSLQLDHGGGQRFELGSSASSTLVRWIQAGAKRERQRHLVALEIGAATATSRKVGDRFEIAVWATFSDNNQPRQVNDLALFSSSNDSALNVTQDGTITILQAGRHAVIVKFLSKTAVLTVTAPFPRPIHQQHATNSEQAPADGQNWIDDVINASLQQLRLTAAPIANDAAFARRIYFDLAGRLPSEAELDSFVNDTSSTKREQLVDALLASDDFTEYWTYKYSRWLGATIPNNDLTAALAFRRWLRSAVAADRGWDHIAADVLQAQGDTHEVGAATFHRFSKDVYTETEHVAETFMGARLRCANCHNHPLDQWTQDDYHGFAQVFAKIERGQIVHENDYAEVIHPATTEPAVAQVPGGSRLDPRQDLQAQVATWLTSPEVPHLSRSWTAKVWDALFGPALFDSPDDLRPSNPPRHPELFDRLCQYTLENKFQLRPMLRLICNSDAYQRRSAETTSQSILSRYYAYFPSRPLSPLVLADAISDVTEVRWPAASVTEEASRLIDRIDLRKLANDLEVFGWCVPTQESCAGSNRSSRRGLRAELSLMNGHLLNQRIQDPSSRLHRQWSAGRSAAEIINEHYRIALCRLPKQSELAFWLDEFESASTPEDRLHTMEDFVWALLNCDEFVTQH